MVSTNIIQERTLFYPSYSLASSLSKKLNDNTLHIIIPVFNESKGISNVVWDLHNVLSGIFSYHITIIDDGSSDNTTSIIRNLQNSHNFSHIQLIQNNENRGKGFALNSALKYIEPNQIVIFMDGDGEHLSGDIPSLIQPILNNSADVVIGSRFLKLKSQHQDYSSYLQNKKQFSHLRKLGNIILSGLISLLYKEKITDSQSGFRAFAPNLLADKLSYTQGFTIETDMLIRLIKRGLDIIEVPIHTGLSTRESHMNIIKDCLSIIKTIIINRFRT